MGEAAESEGGAFDAFDEIVDRFGGAVGDPGAVSVYDRGVPATEGAAQPAQPGRAIGVGEIVGEFSEAGALLSRADHLDVLQSAQRTRIVTRRRASSSGQPSLPDSQGPDPRTWPQITVPAQSTA